MEEGETAMQAAIAGVRQMGFTIVSITAALVAALIPMLFMPDVVGRYFREFGVTLVAAIVASAIVSLTLTPMLCGRLLDARASRKLAAAATGCQALAAAALRAQPGLGAAPSRPSRLPLTLVVDRRLRSGSTRSCRRASCRRRTPA